MEDDERVTISLGSLPPRVDEGSPASATVTIKDDDVVIIDQDEGVIQVSFRDSVFEVDEGGSAVILMRLSRTSTEDITVPLVHTELGGITRQDYSGLPDEITFSAGNTDAVFTIEALQDEEVDPGESLSIGMGDMPDGTERGTSNTATVTILDDDQSTLRCPDNPGSTILLDLVAEISEAGEIDSYTVEMEPFKVYIVEMMGKANGYDVLGQDTYDGDLTLEQTGHLTVANSDGSNGYNLRPLPRRPNIIGGKSYAVVRFAGDGPKTIKVSAGDDGTGTYQLKVRLNDLCTEENGYTQFTWDGGPEGYVHDPPPPTPAPTARSRCSPASTTPCWASWETTGTPTTTRTGTGAASRRARSTGWRSWPGTRWPGSTSSPPPPSPASSTPTGT